MSAIEDEKILAVKEQPAPLPVMAETPVAAATQLPGVPLRSVSPAAEANKDMDHLMGVGGDRPAAEAKAADDYARTGTITGLTGGQNTGDVAQASRQAAAHAQMEAAVARPAVAAETPEPSGRLSVAVKEAILGAMEGLGDIKIPPAQHVSEAKLGTETPPPAAVVPQPAVAEQVARA